MGIGIEEDIWHIHGKLKDRLESHVVNKRAKDGFVFILDNCIESIHPKTQEKIVSPSEIWSLLRDDEVKNSLHNIVGDQLSYLYLNARTRSLQVQYCAPFNRAILEFLGVKHARDTSGVEKEIEFPCLIYFKYDDSRASDFSYRKLTSADNKYLIFHELAESLKTFTHRLNNIELAETSTTSKSPMLELVVNGNWEELQEKIWDKTREKLLDKTVEYSLTAAPAAFVALSTIFK